MNFPKEGKLMTVLWSGANQARANWAQIINPQAIFE